MKDEYLAVSLCLLLYGCGSDSSQSTDTTPIKPAAQSKVVVIPFAYANADPAEIKVRDEEIYLANADDIHDVFLAQTSQPNLWLRWASKDKHHFSGDSQSLDWKNTDLSVPKSECGQGEGSYYPMRQILNQISFTDEEMTTIRSANQIMVLGYGSKNCRFNSSYVNTSPTQIGNEFFDHVVYIDLDAAEMKRESTYYYDPEDADVVGGNEDLQDVKLLNSQKTFLHEYLHTFNIGHANAGNRCSWEMIDAGRCSLDDIFNQSEIAGGDYADSYDIMGNRQHAYGLNAIQRMKLGWLPAAEELLINGPAKTLSSVNEVAIAGSKILKFSHKGKNLYFSNYYEDEINPGFDDILQSDYKLFHYGSNPHIEKAMARNLDGVMLHYDVYNRYYELWSTRLISQSGQLKSDGFIKFEKAAFTEGRYRVDDGIFITIRKLNDGQFELLVTSS